MSDSLNIIGPRVREARLAHKPKLTQDQLSGKLAAISVSIDRAGVSKVEIGARSVLDYEVKAFAKVLGVTAAWLLGEKK